MKIGAGDASKLLFLRATETPTQDCGAVPFQGGHWGKWKVEKNSVRGARQVAENLAVLTEGSGPVCKGKICFFFPRH